MVSFPQKVQSSTIDSFLKINIYNYRSTNDFYYLFKISYLYYIALGFLITIVLSVLLSLIHGDPDSQADPELFTPLVAQYLRKRKTKEETVYMVSSCQTLYPPNTCRWAPNRSLSLCGRTTGTDIMDLI